MQPTLHLIYGQGISRMAKFSEKIMCLREGQYKVRRRGGNIKKG